jgi:hypothetical protein
VLADHPEAAVAEPAHIEWLLVPPDRRGTADFGELLGRQAGGVDLGIGEVEAGRQVRGGHLNLLRLAFGDGSQRACITVADHG